MVVISMVARKAAAGECHNEATRAQDLIINIPSATPFVKPLCRGGDVQPYVVAWSWHEGGCDAGQRRCWKDAPFWSHCSKKNGGMMPAADDGLHNGMLVGLRKTHAVGVPRMFLWILALELARVLAPSDTQNSRRHLMLHKIRYHLRESNLWKGKTMPILRRREQKKCDLPGSDSHWKPLLWWFAKRWRETKQREGKGEKRQLLESYIFPSSFSSPLPLSSANHLAKKGAEEVWPARQTHTRPLLFEQGLAFSFNIYFAKYLTCLIYSYNHGN